MAPQRMRYICRILHLCTVSENPCGRSSQCAFNASSGVFSCQTYTYGTGCEDSVTCMHHRGVCIKQPDIGYMCQCREHFTGKHCENSMRCQIDNPCQNGGTCYSTQLLTSEHASCRCTSGYYGNRCQHATNTCNSHSCGGYRCIVSAESHYCLCPHLDLESQQVCVSSQLTSKCWTGFGMKWTAELANQLTRFVRPYVNFNGSMACGCDDDDVIDDNCEIDVDECASSPCMNGGKCVDKKDGYECVCKPTELTAYINDRCEYQRGKCDPDPCQHGGVC